MALKCPKLLFVEHPVVLGQRPSFIHRLVRGVGVIEHRVEIHVVTGSGECQGESCARVYAQAPKEAAYVGGIVAAAFRV